MKIKTETPPRIRGRVGQGDDDKWYAEISFADLYGNQQGDPIQIGPFDAEKFARTAMMDACKIASDEWVKSIGQNPTGEYLDMKNGGVLKKW